MEERREVLDLRPPRPELELPAPVDAHAVSLTPVVRVEQRPHVLEQGQSLATDGDPLINGYPNEYSQVLLNILVNARDAFQEREVAQGRGWLDWDSLEEAEKVAEQVRKDAEARRAPARAAPATRRARLPSARTCGPAGGCMLRPIIALRLL